MNAETTTTVRTNLPVANFYWEQDVFNPSLDDLDPERLISRLACIRGQFACALAGDPAHVVLVRDPLGVNKLFYAVRADGSLDVANYILDLRKRGAPPEAIFSVPSGHIVVIDGNKREVVTCPIGSHASSRKEGLFVTG